MKTAEAVSDQVLPRFQAQTLALPRKKLLAVASIGFISVPDDGRYTYRIYIRYTR